MKMMSGKIWLSFSQKQLGVIALLSHTLCEMYKKSSASKLQVDRSLILLFLSSAILFIIDVVTTKETSIKYMFVLSHIYLVFKKGKTLNSSNIACKIVNI